MSAPTARVLDGNSEFSELVAVAARAFWHDPLFDFLAKGDLLAEYRVLPHVFRAAMTDFRGGSAELYAADVAGRPRSFAGWLGPGTFPRSRRDRYLRDLRAAWLLRRLRHRRGAAALLREVERRHPGERHWYLALLATDPSTQGQGLGTRVLHPILEKCDSEGEPAYTETQKQENVSWYGRSGFVVIDEVRLADTPPIWRLWREPRS